MIDVGHGKEELLNFLDFKTKHEMLDLLGPLLPPYFQSWLTMNLITGDIPGDLAKIADNPCQEIPTSQIETILVKIQTVAHKCSSAPNDWRS